MSAGNHNTQERRFQFRIGQIIRRNMTPDMMYGDQGFSQRKRCRLGKIYAHQNGADQAGSISHRYSIDLISGDICFPQRLLRKTVNRFNMLPGRDLRNHTAIDSVQVDLRGYAIRKNLPSVPDNGNRRFIAGGFHCQNIQSCHSFLIISASSRGCR